MFKRTGAARKALHLFTGLAHGVLLAGLPGLLPAQAQPTADIFTCVDARGRTLTADRPIAECSDREQTVLNPSGSVRTRIGPTLSARERSKLEAKTRAAREEQARIAEEKRRERALLVRYPNRATHDKERAEALGQIAVVRQAAANRVEELQRQRTVVLEEMEFYKKDPSKAPPSLRHQVNEVAHSLAVQARFIADQDDELKRVNQRFDEQLARLTPLWALQPPTSHNETSQSR
jgi:type I site-specific restriction endonuclease